MFDMRAGPTSSPSSATDMDPSSSRLGRHRLDSATIDCRTAEGAPGEGRHVVVGDKVVGLDGAVVAYSEAAEDLARRLGDHRDVDGPGDPGYIHWRPPVAVRTLVVVEVLAAALVLAGPVPSWFVIFRGLVESIVHVVEVALDCSWSAILPPIVEA